MSYSMRPYSALSRLPAWASINAISRQQVRRLSLHEYQSLDLLREFNASIPRGRVVTTAHDAGRAAEELGGKCTIKPQILHRRRQDGSLDSSSQVHAQSVDTPEAAEEAVSRFLEASSILTSSEDAKQTVQKVYVSEAVQPEQEWYLAMTIDRENYCPAIVLSNGPNHSSSAAIIPFELSTGITPEVLSQVYSHMALSPDRASNLPDILQSLLRVFREKDATLLEVGRLALLPSEDGSSFVCLDASFSFDDASRGRQKALFSLRDTEQEVTEEVEAEKYGLVYVRMDGDIGNVVNGAGLAMATNDAIGLYGGKSANFLDGGGQATKETMVKAFGIIMADERVKVILVNIYGGITDGRMIAESIIGAASELGPMKVPVVVRLQGTNSQEGLKLLEEANLGLHVEADFGAAAKRAVDISKGLV